jgi:hypothetical protein
VLQLTTHVQGGSGVQVICGGLCGWVCVWILMQHPRSGVLRGTDFGGFDEAAGAGGGGMVVCRTVEAGGGWSHHDWKLDWRWLVAPNSDLR